MICDVNIWDDFLDGDDTTMCIESCDFSAEVKLEILEYIKNTIVSHNILPIETIDLEESHYGDVVHYDMFLRGVFYYQIDEILELFSSESVNIYSGIHLRLYSES